MIVTDRLKEFALLSALHSYCANRDECTDCKLKDLCDFSPVNPESIEIMFTAHLEKEEKEER